MGRTDVASLVIAASRERVYAAMSDMDELEAWLPPAGMEGLFEHFDLRSGGSYRMVLTYEAAGTGKTTADSDVVEVRFLDVVPGERLVQAVDFVSDDAAFAGTMTMTWSLDEADGGTLVEFRADDVPPGIPAEVHEAGLSSSLRNLAAHVA